MASDIDERVEQIKAETLGEFPTAALRESLAKWRRFAALGFGVAADAAADVERELIRRGEAI